MDVRRPLVMVAALGALVGGCSSGPTLVLGQHLPEAASRRVGLALQRVPRTVPAYPQDLVATHDAPCARTPLPTDWVARENARHGTTDWQPSSDHAVQLYVDQPSLACGGTLIVHLGGKGARGARVRVLRVGWYGGAGARQVWQSPLVTVPRSPEPRVFGHTVPDAAFPTTVTTTVRPSWTPGLYLAQARVHGRTTGLAAFVVRLDARRSPLVEVDSNLTWAAYSTAGGASLYRGPVPHGASHAQEVAARAYTVSLLRPTVDTGLKQLLVNDLPLARLVDRFGLPVDHVLDTDLEVRPSVLLGRAGVVLPGHAEYWTTRAYDALQAAEDRGTNVADLGANALYWHARMAHDASGRPMTMTVYRLLALDPLAAEHPEQATVRWQDRPLSRPSSAVVGERYAAAFTTGGLVLHRPPGWLMKGTLAGDGTLLLNTVLNEADGARAGDPAAPSDVQVVTQSVLRGRPDLVVSSTYATLPSGAAAFDAGTTTWLCAIEDTCPEGHVPAAASAVLQAMTRNVLRAFSHPRWGASHPARRDVPASTATLLPQLPAVVIGRHGRED